MKTKGISSKSDLEGDLETPTCSECKTSKGVKPAVHTYKGAYFCIECCNYLDKLGLLYFG